MFVLHSQLSASSVCLSPGRVSKHTFALLPWKGCCPLILWACWPSGGGWGDFLLFRSSLCPKQTLCLSQTFSVILSPPGVANFCGYLCRFFIGVLVPCSSPKIRGGFLFSFCFLFLFFTFITVTCSLGDTRFAALLPTAFVCKEEGSGQSFMPFLWWLLPCPGLHHRWWLCLVSFPASGFA